MSLDTMGRLVYMANQIGMFFSSQRQETVVPGIAKHIKDFWDPRMRARMEDHMAATNGEGLMPVVYEALKTLPPVSRGDIPAAHPSESAHHH
ncbi:MAG TPA: formate dehydrogenase subunit delta [Ancylobacter sp.]